jgi:hypothetical protein
MKLKIQAIERPAEPGVYAVASVDVFDQSHSITIKGILVLQHVSGGLGVWFPDPKEELNYGGGSLFALNPELKQSIADFVFEAYERGVNDGNFEPPPYAQPTRSDLVFGSRKTDPKLMASEGERRN